MASNATVKAWWREVRARSFPPHKFVKQAHSRPMHPDWVRSLRDQCVAAGVPFFFKQGGGWAPVGPLAALDADEESPRECWLTPGGYRWLSAFDGQLPPGTWALRRIGKKAAGALLDGREWREFPNEN